MFTNDLSEIWESSDFQDAFIKEYFGKGKKASKEESSHPKRALKRLHHDNEDQKYVKSGSEESKDISNISRTTKKKKFNSPPESKLKDKDQINIDLSEIKFNSVADTSSLKSKKKRKQKSKKKNKVGVEEHAFLNSSHQGASKQINDSLNLQEERLYSNSGITSGLYQNKQLKCDSVADSSSVKSKKKRKRKSKDKNKVGVEEQAHLNSSHQGIIKQTNSSQDLTEGNIHSNCSEKKKLYQNKLCQKLQGAKFRYLNEMLYTSTGKDSLSYFQENKDEFQDYHVGYQSQVSKWPLNPVDIIIEELHHMNKQSIIADLGCGEAKIAEAFPQRTVHSFDLIALKECVTACDMANVPLPSRSVDVAVFCLSLMGTNWKDYLKEGHRLLKLGGELKIAEIESRIDDINDFIKNIQAYGFSLENKDTSHKMFVFLNFKKVKNKVKVSTISNVTLKPCLYKKR